MLEIDITLHSRERSQQLGQLHIINTGEHHNGQYMYAVSYQEAEAGEAASSRKTVRVAHNRQFHVLFLVRNAVDTYLSTYGKQLESVDL